MSIIEQAAQRLEQLRKAGVEAPPITGERAPGPAAEPGVGRGDSTPKPAPGAFHSVPPATAAGAGSTSDAAAPLHPVSSGRRSKVVQIDLNALAAAGYVTPDSQRSQTADEFRVLKRPIIRNAHGGAAATVERGNRVMVSSALPGEGKSFVALNLAISIAAEVDSTVLLVDADVANPNLMKRMHLPEAKGLLDLLTNDKLELNDVLLRTNIEKLSVLPAGTAHRRATEMLASTAMAELLDEMASRYPDRILVFDSPPLLVTTEARVLASHMGQIVMVVQADRTTQTALKGALDMIENCPVVLMVLNKTVRSEVGSYYGYPAYGAAS
jgi:receptor protein-tyrosine kinase